MIQSLVPKDRQHWLELRHGVLTSTEVPALFGLSPWLTKFELYHRKIQPLPPADELDQELNEYTKWGKRLEGPIAHGVAEDNGWQIRPMTEFMWCPERRLGSSFDYAIGDDGLLEVKNVFGLKFRDEWIVDDDGQVEAPPYIECQLQNELLVSKRKFGKIAALVSGNSMTLINREPDIDVHGAIETEVAKFWKLVDNRTPPPPDFGRDADFICKLYSHAEPGKIFNAQGMEQMSLLAKRHHELGKMEKEIKEERDGIKAKILMAIGDCEKVIGDGFSITANTVGPCPMNYVRAGYRMFRVNTPKAKKG